MQHGNLSLRAVWSVATCAQTALTTALTLTALTLPVLAAVKERTISFYNIHTKESATVTYRRNGEYVPAALEKINWLLRDWRRDAKIKIDPKLIDLAWEIHTELGSQKPIHIISGYRSLATNTMLRRTRGGQARRSQHTLGRALDMHFPDVSIRRLRYSALIRERGGVGYYPTSSIPFVHIDTARVRHWPRMRRPELALLFPHGRTKHRPADSGRITPEDARNARSNHPQLHQRIAMFKAERQPLEQRRTRIAAATPPITTPFETRVEPAIAPPRPVPVMPPSRLKAPPRLVQAPRAAPRPPVAEPRRIARASTPGSSTPEGPSAEDRQSLTRLAAMASASFFQAAATFSSKPDAARTGHRRPTHKTQARLPQPAIEQIWARAPSYDEEHPEELSYRPFPIAPFLSDAPEQQHPKLIAMVHPDPSRTLQLLDEASDLPVLNWMPGPQTSVRTSTIAFSGRAIDLGPMRVARERRAPNPPQRELVTAAAQ